MGRMFTTCPGCRMNLAVTATDLRIGQGYVRCGRCERVFNALISLSEDMDPDEDSGLAATGTTSVPALDEDVEAARATASDPDDEPGPRRGDDDGEWALITPIRPEPRAGDTPGSRAANLDLDLDVDAEEPYGTDEDVDVVDSQATGTFETIVLEGDTYLQTEEHVAEEEIEEQLQMIARQIGSEASGNAAADDAPVEAADHGEFDADEAVGNAPRAHWLWPTAAVLLAMLFLAQVVHYRRHSLVANAWLEAPLKAVYGLLGVVLEPAWDLDAYDLRQLGGEAMPGTTSTIVLRASVHNRAAVSQPPPLIRVVLQDRYGNAISTTAIAAQDYLRSTPPARMAPDQRLDAELRLEDPNRQAEGFELDACLPTAEGRIHCSTDP